MSEGLLWLACVLGSAGCAATPDSGTGWAGPVTQGAVLAEAAWLRGAGLHDEAEESFREARAGGGAGDMRAAAVGLHAVAEERGLVLESRLQRRDEGDRFVEGVAGGGTPRDRTALLEGCAEPWRSLGLGVVSWDEGLYDEAAAHFGRAVEIDPGFAPALRGLGHAHFVAGRLARSVECFERARWCAPEDPTAWAALGAIADRRGDLPGALAGALDAWERAPGNAELCERLREVAVRAGSSDLQAAIGGRMVERTTESGGLGPAGSREALLCGGDLLARAGDPVAAAAARAGAVREGVSAAEILAMGGVPAPAALAGFLPEFVSGVQARYRHYISSGEAEEFGEFVEWARDLYSRTTGESLGGEAALQSWTLVGSLVDPTEGSSDPLVRACALHGVLLVLGQRAGGPPEALVGRIARRESSREVTVRGVQIRREVVWIDHVYVPGYQEWAGGGDLAGLALDRLLIIDLGAIARWEGRIRRDLLLPEMFRDRVLAQEAMPGDDPRDIGDAADVHRRLQLVAERDLAAEVLRHEESHIVDAEERLPVLSHPWRNLTLAVRRGFDAENIVAFLERNAQIAAIAEGPSPRAALATCCERIGGRGPHARGYAEIVEGIVERIADEPERFPGIDASRLIVQQLHRLSEEEIRGLAADLMRAWGLCP